MKTQKDITKVLEMANPDGKSRWLWWLLAAVILLLILFAVLRIDQPAQVRYQTEKARRGDLVVTVSATGTLSPVNEVEVGIEVSGTIEKVFADYNDQVKVGQVLAKLDTRRLEAQTLQSQSALEVTKAKVLQAEATLQEAQLKLGRYEQTRQLSGGKVPSSTEMDTARANLARAKADRASAKASVLQTGNTYKDNQIQLNKAVVHSPINGVVLDRSIEPGQTVASSFESPVLFKLAEDLTKMELQVDVDEADVGLVREGQEAAFTVDAYPDQTFPALITKVRYGSETVDGVVTYKTVLTVDNTSLSLRPGMTATATIIVNKKSNVLLVSNAVLRFSPPQTAATEKKSTGGLLSAMLPRPPASASKLAAGANTSGNQQQVWTISQGSLKPVPITKGATDGAFTEIAGSAVDAGTDLVTGILETSNQ
ncbi:efflux RND transporter periplasmic adaptor subunit [Methylovulum miyakonense]|uniref:efflux RND transporter periplasmic adaptor subunit n=1 Tax=Methylovulum miyakonense TaxID=645578 RepID=UPI00036080CB|nr:efflux RND transporter periplasmic adaptor subunit [Methylovulum miyakonense]